MKLNTLTAALLGAGVAAMGTAGAINLPSWWGAKDRAPITTSSAQPACRCWREVQSWKSITP